MRGLTLPAVVATLSVALAPVVQAQSAPPAPVQRAAGPQSTPAASPAAEPGAADPVIAKVGPDEIHSSELSEAAQGLPEQLRGMPPQMLYPMLLDQLVDRRAIILQGRKEGLENDVAVKRQAVRATDTAIQNLLLTRAIAPTLTDDAIKARYDSEYAGKAGEEEVHAAHILVPDEAKAKQIITELKAGKDFNELAKDNSTDPSAKTNNGDLGFFKKTDMLPEFADTAFALKPGEVTQTPVKTRFGWHVIKLLERRTAPAPTLEAVHDQIRQQLIQEGVAKVLASAKQGLPIEKFNQDGTPMTDPAPGASSSSPALAPGSAK